VHCLVLAAAAARAAIATQASTMAAVGRLLLLAVTKVVSSVSEAVAVISSAIRLVARLATGSTVNCVQDIPRPKIGVDRLPVYGLSDVAFL